MKIIADNKIPFLRGVLEPYAEVTYLPGAQTTPEVVRDADALITRTRTACNEQLLAGSTVKAIATATIGFDHIDTQWCESQGIAWSNAPGCNSWSVKQYVASVLVSEARRHKLDLSQLTLGVVGVGNVGGKVAEVGRLLGMRVLLNDPPRARKEGNGQFVSIDEIVAQSDIITLHVPLIKQGEDATWHLFNATRIGQLGKAQILINSSRGPVVDNDALRQALERGQLKGAVLDVHEHEPELDPKLIDLLDIATPHIAGYSADGKANGTSMSVQYIAKQLGLPLTTWQVTQMPAPAQSLQFAIDGTNKTAQDIMTEAILHTYDVEHDSTALRHNLAQFEKLRGDYPVRREFTAFTIRLHNVPQAVATNLEQLGFNLS